MENAKIVGKNEQEVFAELLNFMNEGGPFMWVILFIWILGILISIERWFQFWRFDVDAEGLMVFVKRRVLLNKVKEGIEYCGRGKAIVAQVMKSRLQRANQNKDQIKDAMETKILFFLPYHPI